jgi:hypothetical protein
MKKIKKKFKYKKTETKDGTLFTKINLIFIFGLLIISIMVTLTVLFNANIC